MKRQFKVELDLKWDTVVEVDADPDDDDAEDDAIEQAMEQFGESYTDDDLSDAFEATEIKKKRRSK